VGEAVCLPPDMGVLKLRYWGPVLEAGCFGLIMGGALSERIPPFVRIITNIEVQDKG